MSGFGEFSLHQAPPTTTPARFPTKQYTFVSNNEEFASKKQKTQKSCNECRRRKIKCGAAADNLWPCEHCYKTGLSESCGRPIGFAAYAPYAPMFVAGPSTIPTPPGMTSNGNYILSSSPQSNGHPPATGPFHMVPYEEAPQYDLSLPTGYEQESVNSALTTDAAIQNTHHDQAFFAALPPQPSEPTQLSRPAHISHPPRSFPAAVRKAPPPPIRPPPPQSQSAQLPPSLPHSAFMKQSSPQETRKATPIPRRTHFAPRKKVKARTPPKTSPVRSHESITAHMGELTISAFTGTAPWTGGEAPTIISEIPIMEELDDMVPDGTGVGKTVRIPPKMMPDHADALKHFDYYFAHIHIYQPILSRLQLYTQWNTDKTKISPLLLEGLFSCVGYLSGDVTMGEKWLALSERHKKHFEDAPRVSTMQANLLLMKANEFKMRTGFHYRSWSSIGRIVQMGKDLKLADHLDTHINSMCPSEHEEDCIIYTRLWGVCFVLELMIGGSQGRTNFVTQFDEIDIENDLHFPSMAVEESWVSLNFSHVMRSIKTVRITNANWAKLRKKTTHWASDPLFVENNKNIERWLIELPAHLHIQFPLDGSPPEIYNHFTPNMHMYHYLSVLLQHRPQLELLRPTDQEWARQVGICYEAAKRMCCLQEAVKNHYGLIGLYKMLRGAHFTLYCLITCTMIHSVALFYPETGHFPWARDFTTRHMRILDECTKVQPLVMMREKIEPLIKSMSKDITKEFELSPDFPPRMSEEPDSPATIIAAVGDALGEDDLAMNIGIHQDAPAADGVEYFPGPTVDPAEVFQPQARRFSQAANFGSSYPMQQAQQHQHFTPPSNSRPNLRHFDKYDFSPMPYMKAMEGLAGMMSPLDVPKTPTKDGAPMDSAIATEYGFDDYGIDATPEIYDSYFQLPPTEIDMAFGDDMVPVYPSPNEHRPKAQVPATAEAWTNMFKGVTSKKRVNIETNTDHQQHKRTR